MFSGLYEMHSVELKSEKKNYCSNKYMAEVFRLHFAKMMQNSCIHISGVHIVTDSNNDIKGTEMLQEEWEIFHMPLLK